MCRRSGPRLFGELAPVVAELKRNPGRWARLRWYKAPSSASGQVAMVRKLFPDLEIVGRKLAAGGSAIFARYVEAD